MLIMQGKDLMWICPKEKSLKLRKYIYMEVTKDKYEFPLAIADTARELAELRGVATRTVITGIFAENHGLHGSRYKRVLLDDMDMEE